MEFDSVRGIEDFFRLEKRKAPVFTEARRRPGIPSPLAQYIGRISVGVNPQGDSSETVGSVGPTGPKQNLLASR